MTSLTGTGRLVGLALRQDRVQLPVWIVALTAVHAASVASMFAVYSDETERVDLLASTAVSGVAVMFNGLVSGTSLAAATMSQTLLLMLVATALMNTFAVVRHTRREEESGRTELVRAAVVGRNAPLAAALIAVAAADLVLGLANAVLLMAVGFPLVGSLLAGLAIFVVGMAFAAVAAVAAQVAGTARAANALAGAAVAVAFVVRGVGDMVGTVDLEAVRVHSSWISWLSPIGWGQQTLPYDQDRWLPLLLPVALVAMAVPLAFRLLAHRDLGAGMLDVRPGPARGAPSLGHPVGLAWRLQRNLLRGWAVAIGLAGVIYGAMAPEVEDLLGSSEATRDILEGFGGSGELMDVYLAAIVAMGGLAVAAYIVQALLRIRSEEDAGTLEVVVASGVSRLRFLASHLLVAGAGSIGLLTLYGAAQGLAYGLTGAGVFEQSIRFAAAGLAQTPAVLVLGGITVAAVGILPAWSRALAWGAYAACLILGQLGDLFGLPDAALGLSPFTHLPALPVESFAVVPFAVLLAIAVALTAAGALALHNRDLGAN